MPQNAHDLAMSYRNEVLGLSIGDRPASEATQGKDEELDPIEISFLSGLLERLISSKGDKLEKELILKDEESGDSYQIKLIIEKVNGGDVDTSTSKGR